MVSNIEKIIYSLNHYERKILPFAKLKDISKIAENINLDVSIVNTVAQILASKNYVEYIRIQDEYLVLDKFGEKFVDCDLPEIKFLKNLGNKEIEKNKLGLSDDEFSSAIGILKRNKLIEVKNKNGNLFFTITEEGKLYLLKNKNNPLKEFKSGVIINKLTKKQNEIFNDFQNRKGFLKKILKKEFSIKLTKEGAKIAKEIEKKFQDLELIENLDSQMLKTGSWKNKKFRFYDINVKTSFYDLGRRHPMVEANNLLRDIFIQMGFSEMEGPMVESAFWNMDTMWIPQDHPARDEQDTFYLEDECNLPQTLISKVKHMHEKGIKKTHTPVGEWSEKISKKRLLRTHSTATSFRKLFELVKKNKTLENGKYFYIANNFRNEAIDATHLAEFFQAEGFIIGDDLSLADLMGFIKEFYLKLGIDKIKFKPTFNPYTEPSMEAHYYDEKLNKWYALINSGIFRPETLKPLGINKTIIAWGMGASRVATLLTNAKSMKEITGYTCDFNWLKTRPQMQNSILRK